MKAKMKNLTLTVCGMVLVMCFISGCITTMPATGTIYYIDGFAYMMYATDYNSFLPAYYDQSGAQVFTGGSAWRNAMFPFNQLASYLKISKTLPIDKNWDAWLGAAAPYANKKYPIFFCPSGDGEKTLNGSDIESTYLQNGSLGNPGSGAPASSEYWPDWFPLISKWKCSPSSVVVSYEYWRNNNNGCTVPNNSHSKPNGRNILYGDWHVNFGIQKEYDNTTGINLREELLKAHR